MRRLCAALEKCCGERNERRVANRLKEVEYSWEMLERVQEEYLASINVMALDDNHVDDLKDVYELKERVGVLAEDYIWNAEENKKKLYEQDMERIKAEKHEVEILKLYEIFMQCVRDLRATGEEIRVQVDPESMAQVDVVKTLYERYSREFKEVTRSLHSCINEVSDVDRIRKYSDTYVCTLKTTISEK